MVACELCGIERFMLTKHLKSQHGLSVEQYLEQFPNAKVTDPSISPFSKDFYLSRGLDEEKSKEMAKSKIKAAADKIVSVLSPEYYKDKGMTDEEIKEHISFIQSQRLQKGIENLAKKLNITYKDASKVRRKMCEDTYKKNLKEKYGDNWSVVYSESKNTNGLSSFQKRYGEIEGEILYEERSKKIKENGWSHFSKKYWENRGYTDEVLDKKLKEVQGRGKSYWVSRFGEDEGIKRFEEWKNKVTPTLSCRYSISANNFFTLLQEKFPEIEMLFGENEKTVTVNGKKYFLDCYFVYNDQKICIEFNGDYWHGNPEVYKENDIIKGSMTCKEKWDIDKQRIKDIESLGYKVIVVWESSVDIDEVVKEIKNG